MQLKQLLSDDDAVSPVIGVILMVAITVILAAVIATFVLGLGEQVSSTAPQASFGFQFNEDGSNNYGTLSITHDGGDSIKYNELYVRGQAGGNSDGSIGNIGDSWEAFEKNNDGYGNSHVVSTSGETGGTSAVTAGDYLELEGMGSDGQIRVTYQAQQGDSSATLSQWSGPDA